MGFKISVSFVFVFVTLAFSGFYFVSASEVSSDFIVDGCISGNDDIAKGTCSSSGNLYCDSSSVLKDTSNDAGACTMEAAQFTTGDAQCCPAGYECADDSSGNSVYKCKEREDSCGDYLNDDDGGCSDNGCFWIDEGASGGFCVSRPLDYSCGVYDDATSCVEDAWNLGQEGFGATACNKYSVDGSGNNYVAPQGECGCFWKTDGLNSRCELKYDVQEDIYEAGATPDSFTCNKNFSSSACIDDFQNVAWNVRITGGNPDNSLKTSSECTSGSERRACGEPVIQLPGFSLFALISSIAIIGLFYVFKREED